jgi:cytochrome c-type biogenesis protein CcmF
LCIFGTFLTRSGIVNSVHAFSQGPIGMYFVVFLSIGIAATVTLIVSRLDFLKSEASMESVLSRESSFLFNNLVLLASCFAILWGTLFPVISEKFTGEKISVDAPFFNRINIPIAMFLLLLTGVGPLIAWRKSSFDSLRRAFLWPTVAGLIVSGGLFAMGVRSFYALVSFGLCMFVLASVAMEFVKGANAIRSKDKTSFISSVIELTHRNTRRYGGYLVHVGVVVMFIGFTGTAFNQQTTVEISKGDAFSLGHYELRLTDVQQGQTDNYRWQKIFVDASKNGEHVVTLEPEKRLYLAKNEPTSKVDIRRRPNEDLYINFGGLSEDGKKVVIQAYVFPLVSWIWVGYWVVLSGTIICLIPSKNRLIYPRMEIVGVAGKHAKV